jgi:hypothetical protein
VPDDDVRRFDPPRLVEVERDGRWWPGTQSAWFRWGGVSTASVRYTTTAGQTYLQNVSPDRVRPRSVQH